MKKIITTFILLFPAFLIAQPILTGAELNINNVRALINNQNSHFWDPITYTPVYYVPANGTKQTLFASNLWVGGYDTGNQLHVSAATYNQQGTYNWWPGPMDLTNGTSADPNTWNLIWKINKTTIDDHIANWNSPGYIIPAEISSWPANPPAGTNYAPVLAPFFDANLNQLYEPAQGEFPIIFGDQAIYFICNDNYLPTSLGVPNMKVEVHGMAFAYSEPSAPFIDNTIFFRYQLGNRSGLQYNDVVAGFWTDADLGNATDDYFGTDVGRNMFYFYNGDNDDDGAYGYGINPPAQGVILLSPPLYSSQYYENLNNSPIGNPVSGEDHHQYMTGTWLDGLPVTFGGDGRNAGNPATMYCYPGNTDPAFPGQNWDMIVSGVAPADMRGLGSVHKSSLAANEAFTIDVAYTTAFPDSGGPAASIAVLQQYADSIMGRYADGTITAVDENTNGITNELISIYPNPVTQQAVISVSYQGNEEGNLKISDSNGRLVLQNSIAGNKPFWIHRDKLIPGVYIVSAQFKATVLTQKMIVQ